MTPSQLNRRLRVMLEGEKPHTISIQRFIKRAGKHRWQAIEDVTALLSGEKDSVFVDGDPPAWVSLATSKKPTKRERQYKHIVASEVAAGKSKHVAERIGAATVNKLRAKRAANGEGPALVGQGGSRRQWWPGKR